MRSYRAVTFKARSMFVPRSRAVKKPYGASLIKKRYLELTYCYLLYHFIFTMLNKEAFELEYLPAIFSIFEMRQLQLLNTSQSAERNGSLCDSYPET